MNSINQASVDILKNFATPAFFQPEVGSTNTWAREHFSQSSDTHAVYLVDRQPQGRGRDQRTWSHGPEGSTLLSTWCFRSAKPPQPILSPLVGMAVYQSLSQNWPALSFCLKAPNDIFLDGKKLLGLLIEAESPGPKADHTLYIGLGMNIFSAPSVDQPTIALNEKTDVNISSWTSFCALLKESLQNSVLKGQQTKFSPEDCKALKVAMANHKDSSDLQDSQILDVLPDGSIVLENQTLHWRDL